MSIEEELEGKKEVGAKVGTSFIEKLLTSDSSPKSVESFKTHALNWDGKESTARIIKGLEGLLGNLDKAVIDLLMGTIQKTREFIESTKKVE